MTLTPDFYSYPQTELASAELDGDWVQLGWPDGLTLRAHRFWLTENTPGRGFDRTSRESIIDPSAIADQSRLSFADVSKDGSLHLTWVDGEQAMLHPGWLRHVADGKHRPGSYLPTRQQWDTSVISEPPTTNGSRVLEDSAVMYHWLSDLARYGVARMTQTPTDRSFVKNLAAKIGPLRSTNFGSTFTVEAKVERDSTAYTGLNLGQHTDLPTRETPPGFQFLHCVENTVAGGWSRMTDGEAIVAELIEHHPEAYAALTDLHWIFFNRSPDCDHRWSGPMIDHGGPDQPLTLRAFYPVRAFPDMAEGDIPRAYAAMKVFSDLAHDDRFQMRFPFTPGDIVGFDNRRVLHGRDAFAPSEGSRVLRGMYIDQDEVYSTLRVLGRSLA